MKPLIIYVDDEPMNLVVFEAAMPDTFEVKTFDTPVAALAAMEDRHPAVIVSDQKMPHMNGVQFLEIAKQLRPNAIRMIVTGYSDEELVVQSVRKAQIFDYLKKPWDPDELDQSLQRAVDFFQTSESNRRLNEELRSREQMLQDQNANLNRVLLDLEKAKSSELELRKELECWVPPFVQWAVQQKTLTFPINRDLTGITFDIINSSQYHDTKVDGRPIRSQIIQIFSECIMRHNGWRESHSGDSAYGHFGLQGGDHHADAALSVAQEFRAGLKSLTTLHAIAVECGIGLHMAKNSIVDIHTVQLNTPRGLVVQKSFDTSSIDIDLLHRIEKMAHELPGSNIIMSRQFRDQLRAVPNDVEALGHFLIRGQQKPVELFLIRSYFCKDEHVESVRAKSLEKTDPSKLAS